MEATVINRLTLLVLISLTITTTTTMLVSRDIIIAMPLLLEAIRIRIKQNKVPAAVIATILLLMVISKERTKILIKPTATITTTMFMSRKTSNTTRKLPILAIITIMLNSLNSSQYKD